MKEQEVNKIMEDITNGETLHLIREALEAYDDSYMYDCGGLR